MPLPNHLSLRHGALVAAVLAAVACAGGGGGGAVSPNGNDRGETAPAHGSNKHTNDGAVPSVEAEVGALDAAGCKHAFENARPSIDACFDRARQQLPFIEGQIEVFVRVAGDGSTAFAYPRNTTLGHRATERCVVAAVAGQRWPKPMGGGEGETTQTLSINTHERPPVAWTSADLGRNRRLLTNKLRRCQQRHGGTDLNVTMYVDPNGRVLAAGAASQDEAGRDALQCAADAPIGMRFNSPGSYPAKVTVSL